MKARKFPISLFPVFVGALLMLFASPVFCDNRVDINVSDACIISPGNDSLSSRVLFKFDLPSRLDDKHIDYAEIVFRAKIDTLSRHPLIFAGGPMTTDWSTATVSWSDPWTSEGGDFNESLYPKGLIKANRDGLASFNVTRLVRNWQQESIPNYGLIIIPVEEERRITRLARPSGFPQGVLAKVIIYFSYTHP